MTYTIQLRRDDAADWTSVNPILHDGEFGWERDTGKFKIGDGATVWNTLPYTSAVPDDLVEALGDLSDVDLTGAAAGNLFGTDDGVTWGPVDAPATADPDAMHSSPAHLLYTYGTVAPSSPADGDIWTDPSDNAPDSLIAAMAAALVAGTAITITPVGNTFVFDAQPGNKDRRWKPEGTVVWAKEFRDAADLTGAIRVDNSTPTNAASQARMVVSRGHDSLSILLDGAASQDAAAEQHGWMFPHVLAVGDALECHILDAGLSYNYSYCGLVVSDGVTPGAGNQVTWQRWSGGSAPNMQDALWTNWNTRGAFGDRPDGGFLHMPFMRIRRSATTTWNYECSVDGNVWLTIATRTLSMTPSHVGLAGGQWGATGKRLWSIDNLRVVTP